MANLNFAIKLGLMADGLKSGLNSAKSALSGFASSVKSAMGMIAGAFAAGQLKAFGQECLNLYKAQATAETKLATVMKQRMNASDAEVKSILELTSAQQKLGVIGDEVQIAGAQQVSTFLKQKDSLNQLIPAMNNLLAQTKGLDATQGDAVTIGNLMGKAMMGQTSALKKYGISLDEAQEKVMKYGTESQKAAMLAQIIKDNVGDMNSELAKTDLGKIQQMNNNLGDMKEKIGAAIAPIVSKLAPIITNFAEGASDSIAKFVNYVGDHFKEIGQHIIAAFAATKIMKGLSAMSNAVAANQAKLDGAVRASAIKRENHERKVSATIRQLRVQETLAAKLEGDKQVIAETKAKDLRLQLKQELVQRNKLAEAQIAAQNEATAYKTQSAWKKSMLIAKGAIANFVTGAKALLKSFILTAIITTAIEAVMKLYSTLKTTNVAFQNMAATIGGYLKKAFDFLVKYVSIAVNWLDELDTETGAVEGTFEVLGAVIMTVFRVAFTMIKNTGTAISTLCKLVGDLGNAFSALGRADWSGIKSAVSDMYDHVKEAGSTIFGNWSQAISDTTKEWQKALSAFDSSAEAKQKRRAAKAEARKKLNTPDAGTGGGGTGKGGKTTKDTTDFQKLVEDYKQAKKDIEAALKVGNITQKEANDQLNKARNTMQQNLETCKAKNAEEQKTINKLKEQLKAERELQEQKDKQNRQKRVTNAIDKIQKVFSSKTETSAVNATKNVTDNTVNNTTTNTTTNKVTTTVNVEPGKIDMPDMPKDGSVTTTVNVKPGKIDMPDMPKDGSVTTTVNIDLQTDEAKDIIDKFADQQIALEAKVGVSIDQKEYEEQLQQLIIDTQAKLSELKATIELDDSTDEATKERNKAELQNLAILNQQLQVLRQQAEQKTLATKLNEVAKTPRDTTFDYKLTKEERVQVDLEFNIDIAKQQLEILKAEAEKGCKEAINAINDAQGNIKSLEGQLKLEQVKQDVQSLQKELAKGWQDFGTEAWQAVKGTVDGINSMIETMNDPDASGWEKFCSVINTAIGLLQTVQTVIGLVNTIQAASEAVDLAKVATNKVLAKSIAEVAAAQIYAAHAAIPFAGVGIASGMVASMKTVLAGLQAFANGGFIQGQYSAGDRMLIRANAGEAILNPSQQRNFMRIANGQGIASGTAGGGKVKFEIEGRKLVGVLSNETTRSGKIR